MHFGTLCQLSQSKEWGGGGGYVRGFSLLEMEFQQWLQACMETGSGRPYILTRGCEAKQSPVMPLMTSPRRTCGRHLKLG
ncbi:hypothetical protein NDU88_008464 [Pleurodeles waltl]|uniref:Uncharacterized protein n=1 Tax=Pleurodeles waltl TaxID=8319 RepID=A0AAV7QNK8_PLEWA|nr:hypothetical protein NDU88_008464 [Pleurodeles waltl]